MQDDAGADEAERGDRHPVVRGGLTPGDAVEAVGRRQGAVERDGHGCREGDREGAAVTGRQSGGRPALEEHADDDRGADDAAAHGADGAGLQAGPVAQHQVGGRAEADDENVPGDQAAGLLANDVDGPAAQDDEEHRLPDADGDQGRAEVRPGNGPAGIAEARGGARGGGHRVYVHEQEVGADADPPGQGQGGDPGAQPPESGQRPALADQRQLEHRGERGPGQGEGGGERGRDAGAGAGLEHAAHVGALHDGLTGDGEHDCGPDDEHGVDQPGPGGRELRAGPVVPPERDHRHGGQRERGQRAQDQQRGLGAAQAQGEREEDDRAEQQAADAEPGLRGQMLALQVRERVALEMRRGGQQRPGWQRVLPATADQVGRSEAARRRAGHPALGRSPAGADSVGW